MGDAAPGVAGFPPPGNGDPAPTPSRAPVGSRRQAPRDLLVHRTLGGNLVRGCSQGDDRGSAASPVGANGALRRRATDVRRLKVEVGMLRAMLHLLLNSFTRQLVFQSLFPHMILAPHCHCVTMLSNKTSKLIYMSRSCGSAHGRIV
jgi:hypothetical protein